MHEGFNDPTSDNPYEPTNLSSMAVLQKGKTKMILQLKISNLKHESTRRGNPCRPLNRSYHRFDKKNLHNGTRKGQSKSSQET